MRKWTECIDLQNRDGLVRGIVNYEKIRDNGQNALLVSNVKRLTII